MILKSFWAGRLIKWLVTVYGKTFGGENLCFKIGEWLLTGKRSR